MPRKYTRYAPLKPTCCRCDTQVTPEYRRKARYCPKCWAEYMRTYRATQKHLQANPSPLSPLYSPGPTL